MPMVSAPRASVNKDFMLIREGRTSLKLITFRAFMVEITQIQKQDGAVKARSNLIDPRIIPKL